MKLITIFLLIFAISCSSDNEDGSNNRTETIRTTTYDDGFDNNYGNGGYYDPRYPNRGNYPNGNPYPNPNDIDLNKYCLRVYTNGTVPLRRGYGNSGSASIERAELRVDSVGCNNFPSVGANSYYSQGSLGDQIFMNLYREGEYTTQYTQDSIRIDGYMDMTKSMRRYGSSVQNHPMCGFGGNINNNYQRNYYQDVNRMFLYGQFVSGRQGVNQNRFSGTAIVCFADGGAIQVDLGGSSYR